MFRIVVQSSSEFRALQSLQQDERRLEAFHLKLKARWSGSAAGEVARIFQPLHGMHPFPGKSRPAQNALRDCSDAFLIHCLNCHRLKSCPKRELHDRMKKVFAVRSGELFKIPENLIILMLAAESRCRIGSAGGPPVLSCSVLAPTSKHCQLAAASTTTTW